jgi:hypothetical protein
MKSSYLHTRDPKLPKAISKFTGCSSGKSDGQSLAWIMDAVCYRVGNPVRDGAGLARASTCKDCHRARNAFGRCALLLI